MNLRQIEVFRAVMTTGSTTNAARLLHVSQPGVSRLIRHFELQLGVALFERRNGRLVATPEAHTLHAEVEKVYRGMHHVQDVAAHLRFGDHATLRVLASANAALQLVPRTTARLLERFAQSKVFFETLPTREIVKLLVAEEADVAISSAPLDHPVLDVREIGRWRVLCAMPKQHPLAASQPLDLAAALRQRLVVYSPEAPQSRLIDHWLDQHGIAPQVGVEVRSGYAACAMAATGAGIAFVDDLSARAHRSEELALMEVPGAPSFAIYSVSNVNRPLSQLGQNFLSLAAEELAVLQAPQFTGAAVD
ncbi:Cyn operon transcriptional activator [Variovorax sp. SRS16]|uniref:LysR family transcriptional regulator n=1 Tax=Variovorax sp. SRS16 TaxID=282217 RepID=UPI00131856E6|nr:LysR family transcriptional regulator [Variovorax sp. SRS16]VTU23189.1 Cyn operon transcriptional activator [Variovorax sp. SRS16]